MSARLLQKPLVAAATLGTLLGSLSLAVASRPTVDMDAWWIAATGRVTLATGEVPRVNLFSFTEPFHPWIMHEWLYAVIFAKGLAWMGPAFLAFFAFASACAIAGVVLTQTVGRARHPASAALFAGIVLAGTLDGIDSPRPLYASILFALVITSVAFRDRVSGAAIGLAAATELVWVNAHGSFPLGLVLLAAGAALCRTDRRRRAAAAGAALLVTFVNPHGVHIYALVDRYLRGGDDASALIRSHLGGFMPLWRAPPAFVDPGVLVAFASVVVAAAASLASARHRARGVVALGIALLGVAHVRHLALGTLVGCVLVAPAIDERFASREAPASGPRERRGRVALALGPMIAAGALALGVAWRVRAPVDWISPLLGGPAFVRMVETLPANARVYTQFRSTGLLLWLAATRGVRVLYDARNDCYSPELVSSGFTLDAGTLPPGELRGIIERYGADHVLLPRPGPVEEAFMGAPGWTMTARDGDWRMFERTGSERR